MTEGVRPELRAVLAALRGRRRWLPVIVALGTISASLEGLGIGLIIPMLDVIVGGTEAHGTTGALLRNLGSEFDDQTRLLLIGGLILVLVALKNAVGYANALLIGLLSGKVGHSMRSSLVDRILNVGFPFILRESPGRLLNVVSKESWKVVEAVQASLQFLVSATTAAILLGFLLVISWKMVLAVSVGMILIQLLHNRLSARLRRSSHQLTSRNSALAALMLHLVHAGRLARIFGQERREAEIFDTASEDVRRAGFALERRYVMLSPLTEVLHTALFLGVTILAWKAGLSFPVVVAFVVLLYRLQPHVRTLQMNWSQLQVWSGSLAEVRWLQESSREVAPPVGDLGHDGLRDRIEFRDVSFRYPGDALAPLALDNASFDICHGRSIAIVGKSGSGKSTIVSLLCRLLEPDSGSILVDGKPLDRIDPRQWRRSLALASQDLELAAGSVFDNVAYGSEGATQAAVERAAIAAEAHEFIMAMPDGYDTPVGHRGANLSAGQRQRIALARALVRDPDVLILDEATNALDNISEAAIVKTLRSRAGRRTTIVISHHHSTIAFCDDVVVLRDGRTATTGRLGEIDLLGGGLIETVDAGR